MGLTDILPSKKFQQRATIVIGGIVLIGLGSWAFNAYNGRLSDNEASQFAFSDTDTDGDLLKDWEEEIWGTDPNNPDTDGDGTPDGQEVKDNRDPIKNGNDRLTDSRLASVYTSYKQKSLQNINITKQISNKILPHSLFLANELNQNATLSDPTKTDKLINPIVAEYRLEGGQLTVEDLNLVKTNTDSLREYFVFVLETSNNTLPHYAGNEVSIVLEKSNADIDKLRANYARVIDSFYRAKVPTSLGEPHLQVLNNFIGLKENFDLLVSAGDDDSAKAIYALDQLKSLQANNSIAINRLAEVWREEVDKVVQ